MNKLQSLEKRIEHLEKMLQNQIVVSGNAHTPPLLLCICGKISCKTLHTQQEMQEMVAHRGHI